MSVNMAVEPVVSEVRIPLCKRTFDIVLSLLCLIKEYLCRRDVTWRKTGGGKMRLLIYGTDARGVNLGSLI